MYMCLCVGVCEYACAHFMEELARDYGSIPPSQRGLGDPLPSTAAHKGKLNAAQRHVVTAPRNRTKH